MNVEQEIALEQGLMRHAPEAAKGGVSSVNTSVSPSEKFIHVVYSSSEVYRGLM